VRLRVFVGANGAVESVELVSVDPPGVHFEQAALEAIRLMRYTPALKDGQAVRSQKVIEVTFDPEEEVAGAARDGTPGKR
jgi:TonB family protein